jgi:hypothetical protein
LSATFDSDFAEHVKGGDDDALTMLDILLKQT